MRKVGAWLLRIALALCVLLIGVLAGAELLLDTPWVRGFARDQIQRLAGAALNARVEIDGVDSVSLSHARVRGVRVFDRRQRKVVEIARADATLTPWLLLGKRVRLPTLTVEHAYVDLGAPGEDDGGLLSLLRESSTTKSPPAKDEGGLHIDLPRIRVVHTRVDVRLGEDHLSAREIDADVGVDAARDVAIELRALTCELWRDRQALGALRSARARWSSTGATTASLAAEIAGAALNADAELGAERDGTQALQAQVRAANVSARTLAQLGADASWLRGSMALTASAKGTTRAFDYRLGVDGDMAAAQASGRATLPGPSDPRTTLVVALERARYEGTALPRVDARARFDARRGAALEHFEARYDAAELTAHGQVSPEGAVSLIAHLRSRALARVAPLHALAPALTGALDGDVDFTRARDGRMAVKLRFDAARPAFGETRAERLAMSGVLRGTSADDVQGEVQLDATALHAGQVDVPRAAVHVSATRTRAALVGRLGDKGTFDVVIVRKGSALLGDADVHVVADAEGNVLHAIVRGLRYDHNDGAVAVRRATARYQNAHLELAGRYAPERASTVALSLRARDLTPLTEPWMKVPLAGALDLDVNAKGKLERPDVEVHARYANETLRGDRHLPTYLRLDGELHAGGTPKAPELATRIDARVSFRNDRGPLDLDVAAKYADSRVDLALDARDARGPLVRTRVQTGFERAGFDGDAAGLGKLLVERAWSAELWIGARRIDELPGVRSLDVPEVLFPAQVSADAKFEHVPGKEPEGKLVTHVVWDPPGRQEGVITCGMARRPELQAEVRMKNGDLNAQLDASVEERHMLTIGARSKAPVDEWLRADAERIQPASLWLKADEIRLQDLPIVCEHATGYVSGSANLERALQRQVSAAVNLRAREVTFAGAPPFDAEIAGHADRQVLIASAKLHAKAGKATVAAKLPIDGSGRVPTLSLDEPANVDVALHDIDARALLGAVTAVRTTGGAFGGHIGMRGTLRSPTFQGELYMKEVSVTLAEAGQRFERVTGKVALDGRHLHLYPTTVHDRDGSVQVSGDMTLIDMTSWQAELKAKAKRFRVRRSGVILALFDGDVGLTARVDPEETSLDVTIDDARVELTGESLAGVQSLEPHDDIEFVDDLPQPEKLAQQAARATPVILRIVSKNPFWIRREDFSVLVSTELRIEVRGGKSNLSGPVDIQRGYVELLGQMFDIEQGKIQFTGGAEVVPTLDLVAKRRRPGGATVTIKASGPLYDPQLTFSIDGQAVTAGEALREATGAASGPGSGANVQDQLSAMATGIAGSVLTLGARRELGDWVPVLALERGAGTTRVRAGVEAGRFIPKFLRKVVVDAYVEGIVQTTDNSGNAQAKTAGDQSGLQAQPGVLLELRFPKQLVGEAQYGPGQAWSLDLSWQP
jgi:autotransporter translocation and assembly factor TamB